MIDDRLRLMKSIINFLNECTYYYDIGNPIISDKEYDDRYFDLQKLEKETGIIMSNSPTSHIPYEVKSELTKVNHNHLMLSLNKTKDINTLSSFIGDKECIIMPKMDGLTCSITYEDGKLIRAETRGNGIIGEDITHNIIRVKGVPLTIPISGTFVVDGEIICKLDDFEPFSQEYRNPRNFAAGSIRLLDSKECSSRFLSFVAWDLIKSDNNYDTLSEKLDELNKYFITVFYKKIDNNSDINDLISYISSEADYSNFPIDGCVVKYNDIDYYNSLGNNNHHFKGGIAYKFYDEEYKTSLIDIVWQTGRGKYLTPVAIFEPIDIDGTIVERASLHNLSILSNLSGGIEYKGDTLYIIKSNMIIPQVSKWLHNDLSNIEIELPKICPVCGQEITIEEHNNISEICCNNPNCEGKLINKLEHFCSKKGLEIKGLSKATLEKLVSYGWINNLSDIYTLSDYKKEWINKQGFGEKSVSKILEAIEDSKKCSLESFLAGIGIPLINRAMAQKLCKEVKDWNDFRNKVRNHFDFSSIDGFGTIKSNNILNFDYTDIDIITEKYLTITNDLLTVTNSELDNMNICITGRLSIVKNRDELIDLIKRHGGKVQSSVNTKTSFLVANKEENSTKYNQAIKLGIPIITEKELIENYLTIK